MTSKDFNSSINNSILFQKTFFAFFNNIQGFRILNVNLKAISKFDLQEFSKLEQFISNENPIETIDGDLFSFTPKINYIQFRQNKITNVGPNLLSSLKDLREHIL